MPTKNPPRLTLEEAVRAIKEMYTKHQSREVSEDLMPEILDTKQTSSFFATKINALQSFGLVKKMPNDILYLTDLAMEIVHPFGEEEALQAKIKALQQVDVLADLLLKYPNSKLPSAEQIQQTLLKNYQIGRDRVKPWYDFVVGSFRTVSELAGRSVLTVAKSPQEQVPVSTTPTSRALSDDYRIPLPGGGAFRYALEGQYTADDLEFVKGYFELMKTMAKQ